VPNIVKSIRAPKIKLALTCGVFVSLTNPLFGATRFTGYVGLKNLAAGFATYWQGLVVHSQGYATMLVLDGVIEFLPILVIPSPAPSIARSEKLAGSAPIANDEPA
jgi:hypothetical protein